MTLVWETTNSVWEAAEAGDESDALPARVGGPGDDDLGVSSNATQPASCWLFAQGTAMTFAYHGSTRGATCVN